MANKNLTFNSDTNINIAKGDLVIPSTCYYTGSIQTPNVAGYKTDTYGRLVHQRNTTSDNLAIVSYDGTVQTKFYYENGNLFTTGNLYLNGSTVEHGKMIRSNFTSTAVTGKTITLATISNTGIGVYLPQLYFAISGGSATPVIYVKVNITSGTTNALGYSYQFPAISNGYQAWSFLLPAITFTSATNKIEITATQSTASNTKTVGGRFQIMKLK